MFLIATTSLTLLAAASAPPDEHTTALDQPDSSCLEGQLGHTQIYRVVLRLP